MNRAYTINKTIIRDIVIVKIIDIAFNDLLSAGTTDVVEDTSAESIP